MKRTQCLLLFMTIALGFLLPSVTQAATDWKTLKTEYFTVFYQPGFEEQATEVLQVLEYYRPEVEKLTGNRRFHLPIVINDLGILTNGLANPVYNYIHLFCYPPESGQIGTVEDWNALVAVHEYTHILQMTNVGKGPQALCSVFGSILSPNTYVPGWIIEGITVYSESRLWDYQGRLNDGRYDAYIGARVADDRFPSIMNASFDPHEFNLDGIYTYGGVFFNYLAQEYGEETITEFFNVQGSSWASLDKNAKTVFGKSFPQLWADWKEYETRRFANYYIDGEQVTDCGWNVASPLISEDKEGRGKLYYKKSRSVKTGAGNSFQLEEIIEKALDTGKERVVVSTTSSFHLPIKIVGDQLYYGVYELKPGYANAMNQGYGVYAQLRKKSLSSGKDRLVFFGAIRAYEVLADGEILYAEAISAGEGFGSRVYLYTQDEGSKLLHEVDYLIDEIAADSERIIFSARKKRENNDLYLFSISSGELKPLFQTPFAEYGVNLVEDRVFFNANYGEVYAIYCYDLAEERAYKLTTGGYAIHPAYHQADQEFYFVGLNSYGFDLYRKQAVFEKYELPSVSANAANASLSASVPPEVWPDFTAQEIPVEHGDYWDNLKTLTPKIRAPHFYYSSLGSSEVGVTLFGCDAVGNVPQYQVGVFYEFEEGVWETDSSFTLNFFPPLLTTVGYNTYEDRPLYLDLNYPLVTRMTAGVSAFSIGSVLNYGDNDGTEFIPYTSLSLQYPKTRVNLKLEAPIEEENWGCGQDRLGYYGALTLEQLLLSGELSLQALGIYDPENEDEVFPEIRGYVNPVDAKEGGVYSLEYSRPLVKIRNGVWNWDLYFEDLCFFLFTDAAVPTEGEYQSSYGIGLSQEIKFGYYAFSLGLDLKIGIGYDREGDRFVTLYLGLL